MNYSYRQETTGIYPRDQILKSALPGFAPEEPPDGYWAQTTCPLFCYLGCWVCIAFN